MDDRDDRRSRATVSRGDKDAREFLAMIILALNWFVVIIYPVYRMFLFMMDTDMSLRSMAYKRIRSFFNFLLGVDSQTSRDDELDEHKTQVRELARRRLSPYTCVC